MRALCKGVIAIGLASWIVGAVDAQPAPPAACPATTQVESTAIARAWHDDVINRRNPVMLRDIVGPEVVHHAAGGYPKVLNAEGIAAMMGDFLVAFPDLLISGQVRYGPHRKRRRSTVSGRPPARATWVAA